MAIARNIGLVRFVRLNGLPRAAAMLTVATLALSGLSGCGGSDAPAADPMAESEGNPEAEALAAEAGVPGVSAEGPAADSVKPAGDGSSKDASSKDAKLDNAKAATAADPRPPNSYSVESDARQKFSRPIVSAEKSGGEEKGSAKSASDDTSIGLETPDELLAAIRTALAPPKKSKQKKKSTLKKPDEAPVEPDPETRSANAIVLTEQVLSHPDATIDQKAEAWRSKLKFLSRGVKQNWAGYTERLNAAVEKLNQEPNFVAEAEYGHGLQLVTQFFSSQTPAWKAVERITEYAKRFPNGTTGVRMYLAYAGTLVKRGDRTNAERCCNVALWELKDHPEIERVRDFVIRIPIMKVPTQTSSAPKTALQKQLEAEVKAIRGKLPLKLDHVTTLTNIDSSATSIDYRYEVTAPRSEVMKHKDRIEKTITTTARQTLQTRLLLKGGISLNYAYYDKNGSLLFRFSVKGMK